MNNKILTNYNGLGMSQALNNSLGYGTYRYYVNDSVGEINTESILNTRWFAIQFLQDTTMTTLRDRQTLGVSQSITTFAGLSTNSSILDNQQFSAGTALYGDFVQIHVESGLAVLFGINNSDN